MNLLGYCLSAVPVVAGCGYGVYALTRGGHSVSSPVSAVSDLSQSQNAENITRGTGSLEDTSSSSVKVTSREENQRAENTVQQQRTRRSSNSGKSLSDFKWVLGKGERGEKKELLVQITKDSRNEELGNLKFGSGFTVSADGRDLEAGYFLCTIDSNGNKYFLMKWDSTTSKYVTINGDQISPCGWRNSPSENVTKYKVFSWSESGEHSKPLKDVTQIDLSTCIINGKNWDSSKRRLKMTCKKSSNSMLGGRFDASDISIELKGISVKK